jgi:hypothetical protein
VERGEKAEGLADAHAMGQGGFLELGADAAAQAVTRRSRGEAHHPGRTGVSAP